MSLSSGGFYWGIFGIGAALGPIVTGVLGEKIGLKKALLLAFTLKAIGVALPLLDTSEPSIFISSLLVGIFTPGTVTLISSYTLEIVGGKLHTRFWGIMTTGFAVSQGSIGYLMAHYASNLKSYSILFFISSSVLLLSVFCILMTSSNIQSFSTTSLNYRKRMH